MTISEIYIVPAARGHVGRRKGALARLHPADLGAAVIDGFVDRSGADPAAMGEVILSCLTQSGQRCFAFGRNMVLASKPVSVPAVTTTLLNARGGHCGLQTMCGGSRTANVTIQEAL